MVILASDTFENLPRVGLEAMSSGSLLVVDDRGGWRTLIDQGQTGWRCGSEAEFVATSSRLAHNPQEREPICRAAREKLLRHWGLSAAMDSWAQVFASWEALR